MFTRNDIKLNELMHFKMVSKMQFTITNCLCAQRLDDNNDQ